MERIQSVNIPQDRKTVAFPARLSLDREKVRKNKKTKNDIDNDIYYHLIVYNKFLMGLQMG